MKFGHALAVLVLGLGVETAATAVVLKGIARNGTSGKLAAGDEVVLLALSDHTKEIARGKTDASGNFQFTIETAHTYLVRVVHNGVVYQNMAPAGVYSLEILVYDVARKLNGVIETWGMQRLQTAGDQLQVIDELTIRNTSDPPRTLVNGRPFEIQLPLEAEVVAGKVQIGNEQPLVRNPIGVGKGRYQFAVPLLPGDTRLAIAYRLPYRHQATIHPMPNYSLAQLVVVLPETMKFEPQSPGLFRPMPGAAGVNVYGTAAHKQAAPLAFHVSGRGTLPQSAALSNSVNSAARTKRPEAASTSLYGSIHDIRWSVLSGFGIVVTATVARLIANRRKLRSTNKS